MQRVGGGWGGGGRRDRRRGGGGGHRGRGRGLQQDPLAKLSFTKTIKIDPEEKTPVSEMPLSDCTKDILQKKGFEFMTPVQSQSYEFVKSGSDCVARSRTGTGKTLAFGLPLVERMIEDGLNVRMNGRDLPLVLILEPTRELAIQVAQELNTVCKPHGMNVAAFYGGTSFGDQLRQLRQGVHILVATPGRCLDHISRGTLNLGNVRALVLDEGDTMLEMGFQKDVENIMANVKTPGEASRQLAVDSLKEMSSENDNYDDDGDGDYGDNDDYYDDNKDDMNTPVFDDNHQVYITRDIQTLLFSATMPGWICGLTDKHMKDPVFLDAVQDGETRLAPTIEHLALRLPPVHNRLDGVTAFVEDIILTRGAGGQTIVFTNTKEEADKLAASSAFGNFNVQVLHGDIGQNSRQNTIKQFKEGTIEVLVATDVAARGLDIAGVDLVVHTGPPSDSDTFVHRSGRTGRAGRNGTSILLYSDRESRRLENFEYDLNFRFSKIGPPSRDEISSACATFAARRLDKVNDDVVPAFLPHAKQILALEQENNDKGNVEELLARCLAAISNRNVITSRSILTGEIDYQTLEIHAVFRNGTAPTRSYEWRRLINGILERSLEMTQVAFGKVAMARSSSEGRNTDLPFFGLIDIPAELATEVLSKAAEPGRLPGGVAIRACRKVPTIINERRDYSGSSDYRSGSNGYRAGGGRGGRAYRGGSGRGGYNSGSRGPSGRTWTRRTP